MRRLRNRISGVSTAIPSSAPNEHMTVTDGNSLGQRINMMTIALATLAAAQYPCITNRRHL